MSAVVNFINPKSKPLRTLTDNSKRWCKIYSVKKKNGVRSDRLDKASKYSEMKDSWLADCEHMKNILKLQRENKSKSCEDAVVKSRDSSPAGFTERSENKKTTPRINDLNIQMLSEVLYHQVFGNSPEKNLESSQLIKKAQEELKKFGLNKGNIMFAEDVSLNLPPLKGNNIEEHFWNLGKEQSDPYKKLISDFIKTGIPKPPDEWMMQKGWTKYVEGKDPVAVPFPDEDILVFDVEVCVKLGELPTLATAASANAWYGWVSSDLAEGIDPMPTDHYTTNFLIPFEGTSNKETPRIVVSHNVSYDRARIKEQYYIENSGLRFLDTMSLHIAIGGISKVQKVMLKRTSDFDDIDSWRAYSCLSSLKDVYSLYCNKELEKEKRSGFLEGVLQDIRDDFQNLMHYCSKDILATYEVLQAIFPVFLNRFPHPVTLAGMLEMGSAFLTVNKNWPKFLADADQTYDELRNELSFMLSKKSENACRLYHNEQFKNDLWMWDEDWSTQELKLTKKKLNKAPSEENENIEKVEDEEEEELNKRFQYLFDLEKLLPKKKPFLPGYPLWYRKLCEKSDSQDWIPSAHVNMGMLVVPKLLHITWENFPLYHTREFGWGILVADINAKNVNTSLPFEKLKELTLKNCKEQISCKDKKFKKNQNNPVPYYNGTGIWCDHIVDGCCYFFKLPHKDGNARNVGNPLSKTFADVFSSCIIGSDRTIEKVIDIGKKLTYWRNNRERICSQMVVWLNKKETSFAYGIDDESRIGVILPKVVVCGTLTRRAMEATWLTASRVEKNRIGSELRAMIQAPPGYHIVGADVDSQELWIASVIGDSHFAKTHGSTPLGWMTLNGTKSDETDLHSMTAKAVGISRDHAKILNYSRIYGAGVKFGEKLLRQFNLSMSDQEARQKASKMFSLTKGEKLYKVKDSVRYEFQNYFKTNLDLFDFGTAYQFTKMWKRNFNDVFEKSIWRGGTESHMFNRLEEIATSKQPVTPFLNCRLSRALEPKFKGEDFYLNTRINWIVQSGAVDFLHLMLVCMRWLTNGQARYCFSFHDEVRYLIPSEKRYSGALALHITNLFVRAFCSYRLGIYDLPQSVAFFSSVEIDKSLRKETDDDCVTPSNPHGMEKGYGISPGESLNIYEAIKKSEGSLSPFSVGKKQVHLCLNH